MIWDVVSRMFRREWNMRPFHDVFVERVLGIPEAMRARDQATDEQVARFFTEGRLLGPLDDYGWSLDEPEPFSRRGWGGGYPTMDSFTSYYAAGALPLEALRAVMAAWRVLGADLHNGRYKAVGTLAEGDTRRPIAPMELRGNRLWLDVRVGELFERDWRGERIPRWRSLTLREVAASPRTEPTKSHDVPPDHVPTHRRPGPPPEKDWPTHVQNRIYRALKDGKPVPTAASLADFCTTELKIDGDKTRQIQRLINELLERLRA